MPNLKVFDIGNNRLKNFLAQAPNYPQIERLILANNQIESVQFSINNLPNLRELDLSDNLLTDLPIGISTLPSVIKIWVRRNYLEFDDLEGLNLSLMEYSPQNNQQKDENLLLRVGTPLSISANVAGSQNQYQWYKNGQRLTLVPTLSPTYSVSSLTGADAGIYECRVSSTLVPELVLISRTITINADCGDLLSATLSSQNVTDFCQGDNVFATLIANGGEGFKYTWRKDGQILTLATDSVYRAFEPGSYTVQIESPLGCFAQSEPVALTVRAIPEITLSTLTGNLLEATTTADPSSIYWLKDGVPIEGATGATYQVTTSGVYQAAFAVAGGCLSISEPQAFSITALDSNFGTGEVAVYPNPTEGEIFLQFPTKQKEIVILVSNVHGKRISLKKYQRVETVQLSLQGLPKGLYLIEMSSEQGHLIKKVTKK